MFKIDNQQDLLYSTWNSAQCYVAAWMGGECVGEWIHVYVWLGPFTIHLRLSQHTKWKIQKKVYTQVPKYYLKIQSTRSDNVLNVSPSPCCWI